METRHQTTENTRRMPWSNEVKVRHTDKGINLDFSNVKDRKQLFNDLENYDSSEPIEIGTKGNDSDVCFINLR